MYNKTSKAHVTPKANTEVFVGHGSMIVTVLSEKRKKHIQELFIKDSAYFLFKEICILLLTFTKIGTRQITL